MAAGPGNAELARRWADGLRGDMTALAAITAPDLRVWHSFDGEWLDRATAQARMADAGADSGAPGFSDIRTSVTDRGFLVQATVERDGRRSHVVQLLTVEDGQVVSCEEYIADEAAPA